VVKYVILPGENRTILNEGLLWSSHCAIWQMHTNAAEEHTTSTFSECSVLNYNTSWPHNTESR